MTKESKSRRTIMALVVILALGNLILTAIIWESVSLPPIKDQKDGANVFADETTSYVSNASPTASTIIFTPVRWSSIESEDYKQYAANLRSLGCPELLVRDLITAELNEIYTRRARAIWSPSRKEYWQKSAVNGKPSKGEMEKLKALAQEQSEVSRAILGVAVRPQELTDLLTVQVWGVTRELARLSEPRRRAAQAALEAVGYFQEREQILELAKPTERARRETELEQKKLSALASVLSAEELKDLTYRSKPEAVRVRSNMGQFQPSEAEFQKLLHIDAQMAADPAVAELDDQQKKSAKQEKVRQQLGETRAADYERDSDPFFGWAITAVEKYGLSESAAIEAWMAKRDAIAQASTLRSQAGLQRETLKRGLVEIQQEALNRVNAALGTEASRFARAGDGAWLTRIVEGHQP